MFEDEVEAAAAYDQAARQLLGDQAKLDFPEGPPNVHQQKTRRSKVSLGTLSKGDGCYDRRICCDISRYTSFVDYVWLQSLRSSDAAQDMHSTSCGAAYAEAL
jgi:hypothetical protein